MADTTADPESDTGKRSKLPILLGLLAACLLGGGGFYAVYSGLVLAPVESEPEMAEVSTKPLPDVAFVALEPIVVNLGSASTRRHLKFRAQLEVEPGMQDEVAAMMPRVMDVLNGYLRAVSVEEIEERTALFRLRAQMLRRIQIVTGEGRVRDLLVMEFVLN